MTGTGEYIFTIILAAVFVSVLQILSPGKGVASVGIRFVASIFLVVVAIKPVVDIRIGDMTDYFSDIETDASFIIDAAQEQTDSEIVKVIKERAEAYISDMALEFGADIEVSIEIQKESPYLPEYVTIKGAVAPLARERISSVLEKDFNLPKEAQMWKLAG